MSLYSKRAKVAALSRSRTKDDPELLTAKQDLAASKLAQYVERVVAEAPPLSEQQTDRIVTLLRPTGGGAK